MRAAVTTGHGDRSQIAYRTDYPDPVAEAGEVVLRVAACSLNYHDIFTRRGMPGIRIPFPVIVGSDFAGEIIAVGAGVTAWRIGDRVLVDPVFRDGIKFGMLGEVADGGRADPSLGSPSVTERRCSRGARSVPPPLETRY